MKKVYSYTDAAGRTLATESTDTHTYPSGETTHWAYDARNIVTTVHYEDKIVVTNTHDNGYRLTAQTLGNGLNRTINYDRDDNLRASDILANAAGKAIRTRVGAAIHSSTWIKYAGQL